MKTIKNKVIFCILPILIAVFAIFLIPNFVNTQSAKADTSTYIAGYDIVYDIKSDRSIAVTEEITVSYWGNSGFIRDIPVNGGEKVKNVKVKEIPGGVEHSVYYNVFVENNKFVSIDIGDSLTKYNGDERTYRITYDYYLTKAQEGKNMLALTPVGGGWTCKLENISVTLKLPDGYVNGSVECFSISNLNDVIQQEFTPNESVVDGRKVITLSNVNINGNIEECLRFNLEFEKGALSTYFDFTPYYVVIAAAVMVLVAVAVKFLFFNKRHLVPVVNFEAPDKMDPLIMGKLIDNKVDSEDITSMIFYWADKGYLKINLDDRNDPTLIRIVQNLPEGTPAYEVTLFNEMFKGRDTVKPSQLKYSFYNTVDRATKMVNAKAKGLYEGKSCGIAIMLTIFAILIFGLGPLIIALTQISLTFLQWIHFAAIIPLFVLYALCFYIKSNSLKLTKGKKIGTCFGCAGLCLFFAVVYCALVPPSVIGLIPKIIISILSCLTAVFASMSISRTKEYTEQLNEIVGFKNFITLTEKDRLEKMLEDDPQFYYHVLPYAQVLGVSDKWEEKFKGITVPPPQWMTSPMTSIFEFHMFNHMLRHSMSMMSTNMVARPSSSGASGGRSGSFGGHGGGHGGGGGRFR